jgi:hypothetical protein
VSEAGLDSAKAWKLARLLGDLDVSYGRAEYARAAGLIAEIKKLELGQ